MKTKSQEELIGSFLAALDNESRPVYESLIAYLGGLGYNPQREKPSISFKHDAHRKQIARLKIVKGSPYFALRFSACRGYSQRFEGIVAAWIAKYPTRAARCPGGGCGHCAGEPATHVYIHSTVGGRKIHCGAYALEIPGLSAGDLAEVKALIGQEHAYLMKHEAGVSL